MSKFANQIVALGLVALFSLYFSQTAWAQLPRLVSNEELLQFEALGPTGTVNLMSGATPIGEKEKKEIGLMAKYYVFYQTLPEWQTTNKIEHSVSKRREEFESRMEGYILHKNNLPQNKAFRDLLVKEMIKCFQTVFARNAKGDPVRDMPDCVHTGLLLPAFAQMDNIEILEFLIEQVRDPGKPAAMWCPALSGLGAGPLAQGPWLTLAALAPVRTYGKHDVVKLFAFKGLQVYLRHPPLEMDLEFGKGAGFLDKAKRQKLADRLNPIIDYILNPPYLTSQAEMDGYRYVRCEAIKALAQIPIPYVPEEPNRKPPGPGKILAPTAYALMRVLAKGDDNLYPPSSLEEKFNAVLGLLQINAKTKLEENLPSRYNQDLAAVLAGRGLSDFLTAYNKDWQIKDTFKKIPPRLPWKVCSKLMAPALAAAPNNFSSPKAAKFISDLQNPVQGALDQMEKWQGPIFPEQVDNIIQPLSALAAVVNEDTAYPAKLP